MERHRSDDLLVEELATSSPSLTPKGVGVPPLRSPLRSTVEQYGAWVESGASKSRWGVSPTGSVGGWANRPPLPAQKAKRSGMATQLRALALRIAAVLSLIDRQLVRSHSAFTKLDRDGDGYLTRDDLLVRLQNQSLGLAPDALRQYADCQFVCADTDGDGRLSFAEFRALEQEQERALAKFRAHDADNDGMINKAEFGRLLGELQLALDESFTSEYVEMNFRFADRSFRGGISLGQFLASHATLLAMHSARDPTRQRTDRRKSPLPTDKELGKKPSLFSKMLGKMSTSSPSSSPRGGRSSTETARTDVQYDLY